MTIAEKLIAIADNTPRVAEAVRAARATASGTVVRVDDVLDVEHPIKVQLRSKNLIPPTYKFASGTTYYGISATITDSGAVVLNGTADSAAFAVCDFILHKFTDLVPGKYTLSGCPANGGTYTYRLFIMHTKANGTIDYQNDQGTGKTITVEKGDTVDIRIRFGKDLGTVENLTFYPQFEAGSVATPFAPYTENFSAIPAVVSGKNLLSDLSKWANGKNIVDNAHPIHMKAGKKYTFSHDGDYTTWRLMFFGTLPDGKPFWDGAPEGLQDTSKYIYGMYSTEHGDGTRLQHAANQTGNSVSFNCYEDIIVTAVQFWVTGTENAPYTQFQLEEGKTATQYEPYKPIQTATADANGKVAGLLPVFPTMTVTPGDPAVTVECTYFPQSAASTYQSYQQLKTAQKNLKEELSYV